MYEIKEKRIDEQGNEHIVKVWKETAYSKRSKERVKEIIAEIQSEAVRNVVKKAFSKVSEGFWHEPASSTGKYHPLYACGDSGLARHTVAAVYFAKRLFDIIADTTPFERDVVIAALLLHDTCKSGVAFEYDYTCYEHPLLVKLLLNAQDFSNESEAMVWGTITKLISSHMGKWNMPGKYDTKNMSRILENFAKVGMPVNGTPVIPLLPLPQTDLAKLVARCDNLAADKNCMLNIFDVDKRAWANIER